MADTTMTIMTVHTTVESKLSDFPTEDGQLIFVRDRHKLILDYDGKRTVYEQITELATDGARTSLLAPITGIFYFVIETAVLWTYRDQWIQITASPNDMVLSSDVEEIVNNVIQEKISNGELGSQGAISATDDGNGNVVLQVVGFSVIDDGDGNISII